MKNVSRILYPLGILTALLFLLGCGKETAVAEDQFIPRERVEQAEVRAMESASPEKVLTAY